MNANFEVYIKTNDYSANTIKNYYRWIAAFEKYVGKADSDVTSLDVMNYKAKLMEEGKSSASVALALSSLRTYFGFLFDNGIITTNPMAPVKTPKVHNKEKHYMSAEMIHDMYNAATNLRDKAIILTYASTGMRVSELTNIILKQYEAMQVDGVNYITIIGKGNKAGNVYFNNETQTAINDYLATRNDDCPYLFASHCGGKINASNLCLTMKKCARYAGIPFWQEIGNHALRSAAATIYCESGVPVVVVRDLLRHGSITTTNRYVKTSTANVSNAVMNMNFV